MAILALIGTAITTGQSLFGGGGATSEFRATIDDLKRQALNGSENAFTRLLCGAGDIAPGTVQHQRAAALGYVGQNDVCGYPPDGRKQYAEAAVIEVKARRTIGGALIDVATVAGTAGNEVDPNALQREVLGNVTSAISILPLVGIALLVGWLLLRKR